MNCWEYYSKTLSTILWPREARRDPLFSSLRQEVERLIDAHNLGIDSREYVAEEDVPESLQHPGTVAVRRGRNADFGRCPGTHGHNCCNYLTLNVYAGCTLGCTYCIMQSYLRNRTLEVFVPGEEQVERIRDAARRHPRGTIRIGTGEVGDSLLYDPLFRISDRLIQEFSLIENVRFELKTKTDYVDHLPRVDPTAGMVLGFSLNPPELILREEGWAATLAERLHAARRGIRRGYTPAFHFDPIVLHRDWRSAYRAVVEQLAPFTDPAPAWISLGTLRFPPPLRPVIERRPYALEEFVPAADGKMRYLQPVRSGMYRFMRDQLRTVFPETPIYLCMESSSVWRNFMTSQPAAPLRPIMTPVPVQEA